MRQKKSTRNKNERYDRDMSANINCHCGACGFEIASREPCLSLLCGCVDCRQALEWCSQKGAVRPVSLPELIYVKSDIIAVNGIQFIRAFQLRPEARSTRLYCNKCFSIIGVDHKSYKNNVFMFFKNHCSTTCDLSLKPSAAIYLKDLEETDEINKLKSIPLIYTFSEAEFRLFRSIEAVSKSFSDTNRPRSGQNLKSVIQSLGEIEIVN